MALALEPLYVYMSYSKPNTEFMVCTYSVILLAQLPGLAWCMGLHKNTESANWDCDVDRTDLQLDPGQPSKPGWTRDRWSCNREIEFLSFCLTEIPVFYKPDQP